MTSEKTPLLTMSPLYRSNMKYTKDFDQYLRVSKGTEEYHRDKVKAAIIGGSLSRLSPQQARINTTAMGLSNIKKPTEMYVLCLKDIGRFKCGKKYNITMLPGAEMESPDHIKFKNWVEWLGYFKRYKVK